MCDSVGRPLQSYSAEEKDDEHDVWENRGDIDDFAALRDALDHAQIDERPRDDERQSNREVELLGFIDTGR